jgi:hypothetical protein
MMILTYMHYHTTLRFNLGLRPALRLRRMSLDANHAMGCLSVTLSSRLHEKTAYRL